MALIFDLYIIIVSIIILRNLKLGFFITLISHIIIPAVVRFKLGPISIAIYDVFMMCLILSFLIHKRYRKIKLPKPIHKYFIIYITSTFLLIFLSTGYVPYNYQILSFFKDFLFQVILYIIVGFYIIRNQDYYKYINILLIVSLIAGIYGIFSYVLKSNPYITTLNMIYSGNDLFAVFMDESRGGLEGRTYGTMGHPLAWGQFWNIILCFIWIIRNNIRKYLTFILIAVGIINIVLCGSRTAIVTSIVFLLFILLQYGIKKLLFIIPLSYISLIICMAILPQNIKNSNMIKYIESGIYFWDSSYSERANIQGSSKEMRYIQLQNSIRIMERNPIGGIGYNYEYYSLSTGRTISDNLYGLESILFKTLIEQGIIGLFVFIYTYNILRRYAVIKNKEQKILTNGYFFSFFVSMIFTGIQGNSYIYFMFFLMLFLENPHKICNNSKKINANILPAQ